MAPHDNEKNDDDDSKAWVDESTAKKLAERLYGLNITGMKELNGYKDKNYYIKASSVSENPYIPNVSDTGYVLKIMNPKDTREHLSHLCMFELFDGVEFLDTIITQ